MNGQDWHDQRCRCSEWVCEMQPGRKAFSSSSSMNREMSSNLDVPQCISLEERHSRAVQDVVMVPHGNSAAQVLEI